jgi:N-acetylglucosamine transport system permease protein
MIQKGRTAFIVAFLSPAVLLYGFFVGWPLLQAFRLSTVRWRGVSAKQTFVGFENFQKLGQDEIFWGALKNNLWLIAVSLVALISLGILVALALQGKGKVSGALRAVVLFPQVVSLVVVAILWMFLYNPSYGLLTQGLKAMGLHGFSEPLGNRAQALPAVWIAFVWYALGFYAMLFSAGLKGIPEEITEAAALDGSVGFHRFRRITWPLLWSVKKVASVYVVVNVMNMFALVYLMTQGGPDRSTEVMLTYLYEQAFKNSQFGYATALAVANFIVAMSLAGLMMLIFRRNPEASR